MVVDSVFWAAVFQAKGFGASPGGGKVETGAVEDVSIGTEEDGSTLDSAETFRVDGRERGNGGAFCFDASLCFNSLV